MLLEQYKPGLVCSCFLPPVARILVIAVLACHYATVPHRRKWVWLHGIIGRIRGIPLKSVVPFSILPRELRPLHLLYGWLSSPVALPKLSAIPHSRAGR